MDEAKPVEGEILSLDFEGTELRGELALSLPPGTRAVDRDRALDTLFAARLHEIAGARAVVVGAAASAFARPRDGKDDRGRLRFDVRGRIEADRLIPVRKAK